MSTLDVVAEVLREVAPRALKARQIADLAAGRLSTASKTPETVISRDLAIDVRDRGAVSRFLRVGRGEFVLKEAVPTAFYNDVDPYVAKWTRNLIEAGHLVPGVVDERSIRDLKPADVASYRQCHFFAGIGTWSRALRDAGWPDDAHVWSGSCPCTPFSSAGRKRGFSDEQHLWPEWFRLISACRPAWVFGEQVSSKDGLVWLDAVRVDLEKADYTLRVLDIPAACAGAPHARHRLYFVAYARERGCEILSAPWLHDRGQPGNDAARRGEAHDGVPGAVSNATVARSRVPQDVRADRADAREGAEAGERRAAGGLEPERGGDADETCAVPDAERVVWDAGRQHLAHGRSEVESDRHGEAHGTRCGCLEPLGPLGSVGLGDAGFARGGGDAGAVPRTQEAGEGERIETGDLAHEPGAPGADDLSVDGDPGFRPGDRIQLGGDPSWGGAVGGFWAEDVEWVYCRPEPGHEDGRWRPVESGTFALVDGPAPNVGRTRARRLRGYGNAIVRPVAVAFVESVIDALADDARSLGIISREVEAAPVAKMRVEENAA